MAAETPPPFFADLAGESCRAEECEQLLRVSSRTLMSTSESRLSAGACWPSGQAVQRQLFGHAAGSELEPHPSLVITL